MIEIERALSAQGDEELRAVVILAGVGERQLAVAAEDCRRCELVVVREARAAGAVAGWVASLDHEPGNHAVKCQVVEEPALDELHERRHRLRRQRRVLEQLKCHVAESGHRDFEERIAAREQLRRDVRVAAADRVSDLVAGVARRRQRQKERLPFRDRLIGDRRKSDRQQRPVFEPLNLRSKARGKLLHLLLFDLRSASKPVQHGWCYPQRVQSSTTRRPALETACSQAVQCRLTPQRSTGRCSTDMNTDPSGNQLLTAYLLYLPMPRTSGQGNIPRILLATPRSH